MKINILGGGTWGITLGYLFSKNNHDVLIWLRDEEQSNHLNANECDSILIDNIPENICFTSNISDLNCDDITVIALPSHAISYVLALSDFSKTCILIASKGFDLNTSLLLSDLLINMFGIKLKNIAVLSGPNHAEEIIVNKPTASVIATKNNKYGKFLQTMISTPDFRIYTSNDLVGVQLGGAVKNVIAIASGICSGLKLGDNTRATLVSRGMSELILLSKIFDMNVESLYGLSGLGDLIATSYSKHSRNWQLGYNIAKGFTLDESMANVDMVCEGINTSKILNKISQDNNIDMPICQEVHNILFEKANPKESIYRLMTRELKKESK